MSKERSASPLENVLRSSSGRSGRTSIIEQIPHRGRRWSWILNAIEDGFACLGRHVDRGRDYQIRRDRIERAEVMQQSRFDQMRFLDSVRGYETLQKFSCFG